ncbi:MAG TPA: cysteine desulfurase [Candidatus Aphodovivens avistercoris]|nr:cysteine desulfurase [Candidatus Aphodovivens avistercoris]
MSLDAARFVYLDWAATAPLCAEAARAMQPFLEPGAANLALGANPNSLHSPGRAAFAALEQARSQLARALGARRPDEVVLTSGATEADNAALVGLAHAVRARRHADASEVRVAVSAIEHDAVLAPARRLAAEGFDVVEVRPDRAGFVSPEALAAALGDDGHAGVASVQAANSEVGSIQPVAELARAAHAAGALFHTDAVQALGKAAVDVTAWGADAASFSAHKVGGPKGVGALYLKARTPFEAQLLGGGQEGARRSGTQNPCGAAGFAAACRAAVDALATEAPRQRALRDALYARLCAFPGVAPAVAVPAGSERFLPNVVNVLVEGMESQTMILRLDALGFCVSGGSACSSHSLAPSHVLTALGIAADAAQGALRVSLGRDTSEADVEAFVEAFGKCLDWK